MILYDKFEKKKYLALVSPAPKNEMDTIDCQLGITTSGSERSIVVTPDYPNCKQAITSYRVLNRGHGNFEKSVGLVEIQPVTGRKHQIRCIMSHIGGKDLFFVIIIFWVIFPVEFSL